VPVQPEQRTQAQQIEEGNLHQLPPSRLGYYDQPAAASPFHPIFWHEIEIFTGIGRWARFIFVFPHAGAIAKLHIAVKLLLHEVRPKPLA
jgi:hypothetical protein